MHETAIQKYVLYSSLTLISNFLVYWNASIPFGSFISWYCPDAHAAPHRRALLGEEIPLFVRDIRTFDWFRFARPFPEFVSANVSFAAMLRIKMVKRFGWRRLVSGGRRWQILYAEGGLPRSSEATSLRGNAHRTESILIVLSVLHRRRSQWCRRSSPTSSCSVVSYIPSLDNPNCR